MREKKEDFLVVKKQFKEAKKYVFESRNYIYSIVAVFLLSALFGFVFVSELGFINDILRGILEETFNMDGLEITFFIMQNNIQTAFFGMVAGVFFGIFPLINSIINGVVLGYVFNIVGTEVGFFALWRILPHGIFELPAVFIALGFGLKIGVETILRRRKLKDEIYRALNGFLFVVIPLLIIAAIIEGILITFF